MALGIWESDHFGDGVYFFFDEMGEMLRMDRQTNRQTIRQRNKQTDKQTIRQRNKQTARRTDKQTDKQTQSRYQSRDQYTYWL